MTRGLISLILLLHWSQDTEGADDVVQEPKILWEPKSGSASFNCSHNKDISYNQMYWYRQRPGETMELIVFTMTGGAPDFGDVDEKKFNVKKTFQSGSLTVKDLEPVCLIAACFGKIVFQSPGDLIKNQDESAVITCTHNIPSYDRILWYKKDIMGFKLMGYLNLIYDNPELEFKSKIKLDGDGRSDVRHIPYS
ncbi:hypothetical protein Q8A67_019406 [Cirrhinus molitorella]|uniref:Immunoglobulin V-set domain-containing protein n=1 Tax=Cirrhinus molitorella TaxID=172907 RepID=A0AA88PEG2_9TELE|nr:hypothetical protein Q8A67_019406 [Cirrhinus molitorella]